MTTHRYTAQVRWDGSGTRSYASYSRQFRVVMPRKPVLVGTADPAFHGDPSRHSPEDLMVAAVASCHMLSYLALCARHRIDVLAYSDEAAGQMTATSIAGRFDEIVLHPRVAIAAGGDVEVARTLHGRAHESCYIAASCSFPIRCEPMVEVVDHAPAPPPVRRDIAVRLPDEPGALARFGEALSRAGVSVEGGGGFGGVVHFLVANDDAAVRAARDLELDVLGVQDVLTVRLDQERPGQLGAIARAMADAGVNITCVYSDHDHQLILCVDDLLAAERVAAAWRT
jgi:organic hydroperoxide reductase OsmC/OhrA